MISQAEERLQHERENQEESASLLDRRQKLGKNIKKLLIYRNRNSVNIGKKFADKTSTHITKHEFETHIRPTFLEVGGRQTSFREERACYLVKGLNARQASRLICVDEDDLLRCVDGEHVLEPTNFNASWKEGNNLYHCWFNMRHGVWQTINGRRQLTWHNRN